MNAVRRVLTCFFVLALLHPVTDAQQVALSAQAAVVPRLVNFSSNATDSQGRLITGIAGATFAIYKEQYEGSPLWLETQNIQADGQGNYTVQLGATKPEGLPLDLFTSGEARWLAVTINGGIEQPRVLLLSVPYALKASDSDTIGGLPPSAFMLAAAGEVPASKAAPLNYPAMPPPAVASVGLSAPASDFTVTGSPVKTSGTLGLNWNIAPTNADTANAIVKRDSTGSFNAGAIIGTLGVEGETALNCAGCAGVSGVNSGGGVGVYGINSGDAAAIVGQNSATSGGIADGVDGVTSSAGGSGVAGINNGGGVGVYGTGGTGVYATGGSNGTGVYATGLNAFFGQGTSASSAAAWIEGFSGSQGGRAVEGIGGNGTNSDGEGGIFFGGEGSVYGDGVDGVAGTGYAGFFQGNVDITGNLYAGAKYFKIDHPLDPAGKYLYHASVESSEMMDIYTGNIVTDNRGEAIVNLPDWFEALNTDFRYQLTVVGQFAQAIIASKIQSHAFTIRSSMPNVEISWQVTGVRHDAYAKAHPLVVDEAKDAGLRGFYIHPELYGAPQEKQEEWARHPETMKRIKNPPPKR